jgi:hypothetical protein
MTTASKLTIQSEISLDQLYRIITQLPWKQRLKLADDIKREALREQWRALSDTLPDVSELSEDEILAEVKAARKDRANP